MTRVSEEKCLLQVYYLLRSQSFARHSAAHGEAEKQMRGTTGFLGGTRIILATGD